MPIPEIEFFQKSLDPPPITPMMGITKNRHVLAVPDLKRSADYYERVLGFRVSEIGDPGWRFAERDGCLLMLGECPNALPPTELGDHSYFAYFEVDNIDTLYKEFADKGANMQHPPTDQPWGMREFPVQTIDGHRINFGQEL
jgi:predicted enzyme related to lactoylglutathione lyase